MQVVCCQSDTVWEDKAASHARVSALLEGAPIRAGALVVLPEMFSTGFSLDVPKIAEDGGRVSESFLSETAAQLGAYVMGGVVHLDQASKGRNEAVVFAPNGSLAARYCKIHPFTFGRESEHFAPGHEIVTFRCHDFTIAPLVCYDLRFPEVFRHALRDGADLFCVIANWPSTRVEHWMTLLRARAIENQSYVVGVNRCGEDPNLAYPGRSMILDPQGRVLAEAGGDECVITADVDLDPLEAYRREFSAVADMRDDFLFRKS